MSSERALDLAWAAGILEGEGSIGIARRRPRPRASAFMLQVSVTMTDEACVRELARLFPGWVGIHHRQTDRKRQSWIWIVTAAAAAETLRELQPYLRTDRMQRKTRTALAFQAIKRVGGATRSAEDRLAERILWTRMRVLNVRGIAA